MGYNKSSTSIIEKWFDQCLELKNNEQLLIPCEDKTQQNSLKTKLYGLRKAYSKVDAIVSEKLTFSHYFENGLYIKCYKKVQDPTVAILRSEGKDKTVKIRGDLRNKQIIMMLKDNYDKTGIEESIGPLTLGEKKEFFDETINKA